MSISFIRASCGGLAVALILAGCGIFGKEEEDRLPGEEPVEAHSCAMSGRPLLRKP